MYSADGRDWKMEDDEKTWRGALTICWHSKIAEYNSTLQSKFTSVNSYIGEQNQH